jgi:hypothetical protein
MLTSLQQSAPPLYRYHANRHTEIDYTVKLTLTLTLTLTLRHMEVDSTVNLFEIMYKSWCLCPIATLSLCLLCQKNEHAAHLLEEFQSIDFTVRCFPLPGPWILPSPIDSAILLVLVNRLY